MGFQGKLGHGRDDGLYAEAMAMGQRREAAGATARGVTVVEVAPAPPPAATAATPTSITAPADAGDQPWQWKLSSEGAGDVDALAAWMPVVEAIHNGRRTGLRCPYCSEPLSEITAQAPFLRVTCSVCGESFEGRLG